MGLGLGAGEGAPAVGALPRVTEEERNQPVSCAWSQPVVVARCGPCPCWALSIPAMLSTGARGLGVHARWSQTLSSSDLHGPILAKQRPGVDQ